MSLQFTLSDLSDSSDHETTDTNVKSNVPGKFQNKVLHYGGLYYEEEDEDSDDDFIPLIPTDDFPLSPPNRGGASTEMVIGELMEKEISFVLPAPRSSIYSRPKAQVSPTSGANLKSITKTEEEKLTFASCMYNHFDVAVDQVTSGVYAVKRVIAMARKIVAMEEEHYKSLQKALHHELTKTGKIGSDNMYGFMDIFSTSKGLFERMADEHKNIADNVNKRVLLPLTDFFHASENRLKTIVTEEHRLSKEVALARSNVTKCERECRKLHQRAKHAFLATEAKCDPKKAEEFAIITGNTDKTFVSKMKHKLAVAAAGDPKKICEQLSIAARHYQEAIAKGNHRLQLYVDRDLPKVFDDLQMLETDRLTILNDKLETLHRIYQRIQNPITNITNEMVDCNKDFSVHNEIHRFLVNFNLSHGDPAPLQQFTYHLPCTPEDIDKGRLDAHPNSVFKASLEGCMAIQEKEYPTLDVPRILPLLIKAIKERDGITSEGIFRISHQKEELTAMRALFEKGDYTITSSSPHACAALLKEWLRDLAEALIPTESYPQAVSLIRAAGDNDVPAGAVLDIYNKLEPVNRNVIRDIAALCGEISSPENRELNRMTIDNLAIVFAPSFLRNPSEDPMEIIQNTKYEVKFTSLLLAAVAEEHGYNGFNSDIVSVMDLDVLSPLAPSVPVLTPKRLQSNSVTSNTSGCVSINPANSSMSGGNKPSSTNPSPFFSPLNPKQMPPSLPLTPSSNVNSSAPTPIHSPMPPTMSNPYNSGVLGPPQISQQKSFGFTSPPPPPLQTNTPTSSNSHSVITPTASHFMTTPSSAQTPHLVPPVPTSSQSHDYIKPSPTMTGRSPPPPPARPIGLRLPPPPHGPQH